MRMQLWPLQSSNESHKLWQSGSWGEEFGLGVEQGCWGGGGLGEGNSHLNWDFPPQLFHLKSTDLNHCHATFLTSKETGGFLEKKIMKVIRPPREWRKLDKRLLEVMWKARRMKWLCSSAYVHLQNWKRNLMYTDNHPPYILLLTCNTSV